MKATTLIGVDAGHMEQGLCYRVNSINGETVRQLNDVSKANHAR